MHHGTKFKQQQKRAMKTPAGTGSLKKTALTLLMLLPLQGCLIPVDNPIGDFGVGTVSYAMEDQNRPEIMTQNPDDHRQLKLQFWYPTDQHGFQRLSYYLELVPKVVHSLLDAPVTGNQSRLPLVVMSHGLGGNGNHSEFISEALASNGYLVAGIDHTYYGGPVRFPDGKILSSIPNMLRFTGSKVTDDLLATYFEEWIKDCHWVMDEIQRIDQDPSSPFYQRIDTTRIAMVSHSFGGAMGMQCASERNDIVATVSMDGALRGTVKDFGTQVPFMMIWPGNASNSVDNRFVEGAFANSLLYHWASIQNAQHGDFADHNRLLNRGGTPTIQRKQEIILSLVQGFLKHYLLQETESVSESLDLEHMPEVRYGEKVGG